MKNSLGMIALVGTVFASVSFVGAHAEEAAGTKPALSTAQRRVIDAGISKLKSKEERQIARDWGEAKQVAEFICRPAAKPVLARKLKGVDKYFLGTDQPNSLNLSNVGKLEGQGQARYGDGWRDFSFVCLMDAKSAKVTHFDVVLRSIPSI